MNTAQILGYPLLPIAGLEFYLGMVLLRQNPRHSLVNKATAALSISAALWSLSAAFMYILASLSKEYILFARLSWIGWFTVPAALQSVFFLSDEQSRKARLVGWVLYPFWTVALLLSLFTDLIVTDGYIPVPYQNSPGPLEMPFRLIGTLLAFWLIYEIFRLRNRMTGHRRSQFSWFLYGTVIFGTGGAVVGGLLQLFTDRGLEPSLSAYLSFPWVVMVFYAITRFRLFDVRLVLSRSLAILLVSLFISEIQFRLCNVLYPVVGEPTSIFISVVVLGGIFFGTPLGTLLQGWINDLILRHKFRYQQMLKESAHAMITILNRDELLRYIVQSLKTGLGTPQVCVFLRGADNNYSPAHCSGVAAESPAGCALPAAISEYFDSSPQPILRDALPLVQIWDSPGTLENTLEALQAEPVLPLTSKGRVLGVLTLGAREDREPYRQHDIEALQTLASHAAIAIENALLFAEAETVRHSLKESEDKFRSLAQTLPAAIFIHRGGKFLYANPAAVRISGYLMEELLAMDFRGVAHPDFRPMIAARAHRRLEGDDAPPQYEFKIVRKSGEERWVLMTAGTIEYEGKSAIIGTIFDVTELKVAEDEKIRLLEESARHYRERVLEEERHTREKERILKDLHDGVGGLTTNINLLAELAQKKNDLPEIKKSLATIADLSRESLSEIRGFIESLDNKEMDWPTIASEFRYLGNTIIQPHGIKFAIDTHVDDVPGSPDSIVTMNLFRIYKEALANVIKHAQATAVDVSLAASNGRMVLEVRDNGAGISEKRGHGRGLLNMKSRADELRGTLTIACDEGTLIRLEMPLLTG